ncbi:ferritin-like domain-containing protein [Asticcacaulis sp. AND118]|uniref:ferritin-like domain-containing protein n=1 Tax=Asticcacaulis sp. AND118 TaxID=2840468 RepID=UPI001CFF5707|nr:ferritin-like domain-containing protein [Asticcacaulis sp. AND118]UDF04877.1 CDGSH iron-sulfur domain-containing protein [Asticcacaulis sp. AND118]
MSFVEPPIIIHNREQLLDSLSEAAEIEHNLMCCYLYAAWSLKSEDDDDLDPDTQKAVRGWQRAIVDVAIDEMTHLTLVANLMNAIGGVAHLSRPNFPVADGYHPSGIQVRLAPFTHETLQHFIYLERPEGSHESDGPGFDNRPPYQRALAGLRLMPSAQDYLTVGHLYRSVEAGLQQLSEEMGEAALFCGDPALQVCPNILALTGLVRITDLASARQAIQTIVEQGEGTVIGCARSHYSRFVKIREAYDAFLAADPDFKPAHNAARNPVMRRPIQNPEDRVWVECERPRQILDLANAIYNHMLRFLAQGFVATDLAEKRLMINTSIDLMRALDPLARELARLKANDRDDCNAGLSFATLRTLDTPHSTPAIRRLLAERLQEIREGGRDIAPSPRVDRALSNLDAICKAYRRGAALTEEAAPAPAAAAPDSLKAAAPETLSETGRNSAPEIVEGKDITLVVDMKRCIHARFCVTGAPKSFIANVAGPWLHPDATPAAQLAEIAHACPSGAIAYRGKTLPDEQAPHVNMMRIRENGPNAIHAPLTVGGEDIGFRATFCRCGASKNKPYCDGSHHEVHFAASGEPETQSLDALAIRNGPLQVDPQRNGPLRLTGNLEICAGTGRVVKRVEGALLCRCGQSNAKPFCDGSHRAAGFEADGV